MAATAAAFTRPSRSFSNDGAGARCCHAVSPGRLANDATAGRLACALLLRMASAGIGNGGRLGIAPNSHNHPSPLLLLTLGEVRPAGGLRACGIRPHPIQGGFINRKPVARSVKNGGPPRRAAAN
ncbi:MAG: hypothetical protein F4Y84_03695 [Caldilineaceae bacterium SB0665_bin_25]|nr:hypothetical protein [Caldilineaceae bacterium SB0665_bin_25]